MKKRILSFSSLLMLATTVAQAQITVTSNDMIIGVDTSEIFLIEVDANDVTVPTHGANQVWDYAAVGTFSDFSFSFDRSDNQVPFAATTAMTNDEFMEFGAFSIEGISSYMTQAATGFERNGYTIPYQAFELNIPGDSLKVTAQTVEITNPTPMVMFDIAYENHDTVISHEVLNFVLDYSIYNNVPGELKRQTTTIADVVGYGTIIMPGSNDTIEALLIKKYYETLDSIFINGMAIPPGLLPGTGLEQGMKIKDYSYEFVGKGFNYFLANIYVDSSYTQVDYADFINSAEYDLGGDPDTSVSVKRIDLPSIKAYPNPAATVLHLELGQHTNLTAEVYNITGQLILSQLVTDNKIDVSGVQAGSYFVRVKNATRYIGSVSFIKE